MQHHHTVDASAVFAGPLGNELRAKLAPHENVLAIVPVDLSGDLRFGNGLLALTPDRLLACDPATHQWSEWALAVGQSLRLQDHGGVGNLELHDHDARLGRWNMTLTHQAAILLLMQQFDRQRERIARLEAEVRANTEEQREAYRAMRKAQREGMLNADDDDDFDDDDDDGVEVVYAP